MKSVELEWSNYFKIDEIDNYLKDDVKGVYIIVDSVDNTSQYVSVYVGESHEDRLNERIKSHFTDSEPNKDLKKFIDSNKDSIKVTFARCDNFSDDGVLRIEKFLLNELEEFLEFNTEKNPTDSDPIPCNLPNKLL